MENNLYFKDGTTRIIFALVVLNGKLQLDFLGVDYGHYCDKEADFFKDIFFSNSPENETRENLDEIIEKLEKLKIN